MRFDGAQLAVLADSGLPYDPVAYVPLGADEVLTVPAGASIEVPVTAPVAGDGAHLVQPEGALPRLSLRGTTSWVGSPETCDPPTLVWGDRPTG